MSGAIAFFGAAAAGRPPVVVTANNVSASDGGFAPSGTVTTTGGDTNTSASGGVPGYSYSWSYVSGSVAFGLIGSTTVANPQWQGEISSGPPQVATWRVQVTDSVGGTDTHDITVTLTWIDFS